MGKNEISVNCTGKRINSIPLVLKNGTNCQGNAKCRASKFLDLPPLLFQINMFDYVKHCYNGRYAIGSVLRSWVPELVCVIDYQRRKVSICPFQTQGFIFFYCLLETRRKVNSVKHDIVKMDFFKSLIMKRRGRIRMIITPFQQIILCS